MGSDATQRTRPTAPVIVDGVEIIYGTAAAATWRTALTTNLADAPIDAGTIDQP